MSISRSSRRFIYVVIASLVVLLATDVGARILYLVWTKEFPRAATLRARRARLTGMRSTGESVKPEEVRQDFLNERESFLLHPYRAYVYTQPLHGEDVCAWNAEAVLTYGGPAPREASPDRIVIGLFGGSLAFELGLPRSGFFKSLQDAPALRGKEVRLINAAMNSGQMPQQWYALSYLLLAGYHFDVILNLDGYNDLNPWRPSVVYPIMWEPLLASFDDLGRIDLLAKMRIVRLTRQRLAGAIDDSSIGSHSALVNLVWGVIDRRLEWRTYALEQNLRSRSSETDDLRKYIIGGPRYDYGDIEKDPSRLMEAMVRMWADGSAMMGQVARSRGAVYLHMLQPNQYWPAGKTLTTAEKAHAYDPASHAVRWIPEGYRRLLTLESGVIDPTPIFRDVAQTVYRDTCCHLEDSGYRILGEYVAGEITRRLDSAGKAPR